MVDLKKYYIGVVMLFEGILYGLPLSFALLYFDGKGVSTTWTGIILAASSFSLVLTSFLVGEKVDNYGHNRFLFLSNVILAVSIALFGFLGFIDDTTTLICVAIVLRLIQGK